MTRQTQELASLDSYVAHADARVQELRPDGVILDRTPFYPRGGGQPGDTGVLRGDGVEIRVTDTVRVGGVPVHVVDQPLPPGSTVRAEIDWGRRYLLMRTHTALHVLSAVVWRDHGAKVTGGNMEPGEARMDFELDAMSGEFARDVEERLNVVLASDRPVRVLLVPRSEALEDPELIRTKVNLIPPSVDPIRVIDIDGVDRQADGGTHVRSTGEVGQVRVTKTESKGRAFKRMRIALG